MTNSNEIRTYAGNTYHRPDIRFNQAHNEYTRIDETDRHYIYEVIANKGTDTEYIYWEIFEKGHLYKNRGTYASTIMNDGDEMYPIDDDFGTWAWCYSDKEYAMKRWNRLKGKANDNYDGYIKLANELIN